MAYVSSNPYLSDEEQKKQGGQATQQELLTSGPSSVAGGGGGQVNKENQTSNNWVNIGEYLRANQGDQSTSQLMKSQLGGGIEKAKSEIESGANQAKSQSDEARANAGSVGVDKASKLLDDASKAQGAQSQDATNKLKAGLNAQYSGPQSWEYKIDPRLQSRGQALQGQDTNAALLDVASQAASDRGAAYGSGAQALDKQLWNTNAGLQGEIEGYKGQFKNLNDLLSSTSAATNAQLASNAQAVANEKQKLSEYLGAQKAQEQDILNKEIIRQRAAIPEAQQTARNQYNALMNDRGLALQAFESGLGGGINQGGMWRLGFDPRGMSKDDILKKYESQYKIEPGKFESYYTPGNVSAPTSFNDMWQAPKAQDISRFNALAELLGGDKITQKNDASLVGPSFDQKKAREELQRMYEEAGKKEAARRAGIKVDKKPGGNFTPGNYEL